MTDFATVTPVRVSSATADLLQVHGLSLDYPTEYGWVRVVDDFDLNLRASETLGVVGESGSGKSVTSLAIAGLTRARGGRIAAGSVLFEGEELTKMPERQLRALRGRRIGMIFQQPSRYLNPAFTVGEQISEVLRQNLGTAPRKAWQKAVALLDRVGIAHAATRANDYPHTFSGGMCQRVMIAIALACEPKLLIADEPTTALDVTVQARILDLLRDLRKETAVAIILISHDLGVVTEFCDRALVMYAGQSVEQGTIAQILSAPRHPYTAALLGAAQLRRRDGKLITVPGIAPRPGERAEGCRFYERCPRRVAGLCEPAAPRNEVFADGQIVRCVRARD
jgi:peptide/nickel transport system ATP-binding protein